MTPLQLFLAAFQFVFPFPGPGKAPSSAATPIVLTITNFGTVRNDGGGYYAGIRVVVGGSPINVTQIARYVSAGDSHIHNLCLAGTGITDTIVSINTSGLSVGFNYVSLGGTFTLAAGNTYFVASQETTGQDHFYDLNTTVTSIPGATVYPTYSPDCVAADFNASLTPANGSYGLVNAK